MRKLFVVGCPRSGTTMVQQALNRHSQIVIPPETKFFFSFFGQSRKRQRGHIRRLNADLGIRLSEPAARVCTAADGRAFYELMAREYVRRVRKDHAVYFGEKTPEHTGHLPRIRELFPEAKVLVLYRDGRDVALSLSRMPWMSPDLYVCFMVWLYYHWAVQDARRAGWPDLHFARYEDIVADPEKELRGVLDFLGLAYEPEVARGWGNREGIPEREFAWKGRALEKITDERVGVFRRELSPAQIDTLERLGRNALPALGYRLTGDGNRPLSPGFLLSLAYNTSRFVCRLPWSSVVNQLFSHPLVGRPGRRPRLAPCLPARV